MRKLQTLIAAESRGFSPYSKLHSTAISRIAQQCRRDEIADAYILIKELKAELARVPAWDGDTQDDILRSLELFKAIIDKVR